MITSSKLWKYLLDYNDKIVFGKMRIGISIINKVVATKYSTTLV